MNSSAMRSPITSTRRGAKPSTSDNSRVLSSASPGSGCTERAISIGEGGNVDEGPAYGFNQVVHHCIGRRVGRMTLLLDGAVPGAHQHAPGADLLRHRDIEPPVAHDH